MQMVQIAPNPSQNAALAAVSDWLAINSVIDQNEAVRQKKPKRRFEAFSVLYLSTIMANPKQRVAAKIEKKENISIVRCFPFLQNCNCADEERHYQ